MGASVTTTGLYVILALMKFLEKVSLSDFSTMRLGGTAAFACEISSKADLTEALEWAARQQLGFRMIGSGSNIIWRDEGFDGLLIVNRIKRFEITQSQDQIYLVTVGGGENWDSVVGGTVDAGLTGIEALSLIPGTCGATPVQNVGAYGQDVSQTLVSLEAYDTESGKYVTLLNSDCGFSYRSSRFKADDNGRFMITEITFGLLKTAPEPPFYPPVAEYLERHGLVASAATVRQAVIAIRSSKLPDPAVIGNTGSFFANPIITEAAFASLSDRFPGAPHWKTATGVKVSGAWLIEQAGFKDFHDPLTGMATWPKQPLVLVNETAEKTADLLTFKQTIVDAVQAKFAIRLEQEPELLP